MKERLQADADLIRLVNLLLDGQTLTVERICKELRCKEPAARRKFAVLKGLKDVAEGKLGPAKSLRVSTLFASSRVSGTGVCALALASSVATTVRALPLSDALRRLTSDVVATSKQFSQADHLDRKFWLVARGGDTAVQDAKGHDRLLEVITAILSEKRLALRYEHGDGRLENLEVEPLTLAYHDQQFYVVSRKADGSFYPYRLSRMRSVIERGSFKYPSNAEYQPTQLFRDAFGIFISSSKPVERVVIRLRKPFWVRYAQQHRWHESQRLFKRDDGAVDIQLSVRICHELERWVLWFGADAEVIEPASLRDTVRAHVAELIAQYGADSGHPAQPELSVTKSRTRRAKSVQRVAGPRARRAARGA